jgi:hypothetical protein
MQVSALPLSRVLFVAVLAIGVAFLAPQGAPAADSAQLFIYHSNDGDVSDRDQYLWRILRTALDHTRALYGDYDMRAGAVMEQARRIYSLSHDDGTVTVSVFPAQGGYADIMTPIRIPVDRGLLGMRILLIKHL